MNEVYEKLTNNINIYIGCLAYLLSLHVYRTLNAVSSSASFFDMFQLPVFLVVMAFACRAHGLRHSDSKLKYPERTSSIILCMYHLSMTTFFFLLLFQPTRNNTIPIHDDFISALFLAFVALFCSVFAVIEVIRFRKVL